MSSPKNELYEMKSERINQKLEGDNDSILDISLRMPLIS
jgi:hypothetical protein